MYSAPLMNPLVVFINKVILIFLRRYHYPLQIMTFVCVSVYVCMIDFLPNLTFGSHTEAKEDGAGGGGWGG